MQDKTEKAPPSALQLQEALNRLKNKLAGHALMSEPVRGLSPQMTTDLRLVIVVVEGQQSELNQIDHLLARRTALDDLHTRPQKIQKAINVAAESDQLRGSLAAKTSHLLDIYAALGVTWGSDPFKRIADLKVGIRPSADVVFFSSVNHDRCIGWIESDASPGTFYPCHQCNADKHKPLPETPTEPRDMDSRTKPNQVWADGDDR